MRLSTRQLTHLRELTQRELELLSRLHSAPRLTADDPARHELDGATVLVLEKADGSLAALLSRAPRPAAGPALVAQICVGLAQLHRAGWVHGDVNCPALKRRACATGTTGGDAAFASSPAPLARWWGGGR